MIIKSLCKLIQHPQFGQCAVATTDIPAGTILIEETPLLVVDYASDGRVQNVAPDLAYKRKRAYMTLSRAAKEILCIAQHPEIASDLITKFHVPSDSSAMIKSTTAFKAATRGLEELEKRRTFFPEICTLDRSTLLSYSLLISANAHSFQETSVACLELGCKVTHSCFDRNVAVSARARNTEIEDKQMANATMKHIALRDISKGDILFGSYAKLHHMSAPERRKYLRHNKMFTCQCEYCLGKDYSRGIKCFSCMDPDMNDSQVVVPHSTMYSLDPHEKTSPWLCQNCQSQKEYTEVFEYSPQVLEKVETRLRKSLNSLELGETSPSERFKVANDLYQETLALFGWRHCLTATAATSLLTSAWQVIDPAASPSLAEIKQALDVFEQLPKLLEEWYTHLKISANEELCDLYLPISEQLMTLAALHHDVIPRAMETVQTLLLKVRPLIEERRNWPVSHVLQEYYDELLVTLHELVNGTMNEDGTTDVTKLDKDVYSQ